MRAFVLRHRAALRLLAALLVCLILTDLTLDASCDAPPSQSSAGVALSDPGGSASDACAPLCVPDCYCCSRGVAAAAALALPDTGPMTMAPPSTPVGSPDGVHSVPFHPPLRLV
jgi:hypothetical protein